jgi:transcriptional regulator with XRE-family HTH domain
MVTGETLKSKRIAARIAGHILCRKLAIARSRLSDIERGYVTATPEELARLDAVLDDLIRAKSVLRQTAAALGWPVSEVS